MDFGLSDEQQLLVDNLQEWLDRTITEEDVKKWYYEDHAIPADIYKSYYDAGFATLGLPEKYGGTPITMTDAMLVAETLARHTCCHFPLTMGNFVVETMLTWGSQEQIDYALDLYERTGTVPFGMAVSEPEAGSDAANIKSYVFERDGKLYLKGQKTWVSGGDGTEKYLVSARDGSPDAEGMSMWLVDAHADGISTAPLSEIGFGMSPFCEVYFDEVEIKESDLIGPRGKGFIVLMKNFERERVSVAAGMLGMAEAAQADAGAYANQRVCFKRPIKDFQLVQEMLTDNEIAIKNMRNLVFECAWKIDNGMDVRTDTALLKRYVSKEATEVGDRCIQIFAGLGYTRETRVSRCWLDSRGLQIGGGTREIMVHIAGRQLAKKYAV